MPALLFWKDAFLFFTGLFVAHKDVNLQINFWKKKPYSLKQLFYSLRTSRSLQSSTSSFFHLFKYNWHKLYFPEASSVNGTLVAFQVLINFHVTADLSSVWSFNCMPDATKPLTHTFLSNGITNGTTVLYKEWKGTKICLNLAQTLHTISLKVNSLYKSLRAVPFVFLFFVCE